MPHTTKRDAGADHSQNHGITFASILIVDDENFFRKHLRRLCAKLPFTTHLAEANSLHMLRDRLSKDHFDLILLDYHLNDGTGLDGADIISADPVNSDAAVIMITGTERKDIILSALKAGFSDFLNKDNLDAQALVGTAITALDKRRSSQSRALGRAERCAPQIPLEQFSRECAQDIKPIVSRMMRQIRDLRESDGLTAVKATARIEGLEASMRRLWFFLEDMDRVSRREAAAHSALKGTAGNRPLVQASAITNRPSPTEDPTKNAAKRSWLFRQRSHKF